MSCSLVHFDRMKGRKLSFSTLHSHETLNMVSLDISGVASLLAAFTSRASISHIMVRLDSSPVSHMLVVELQSGICPREWCSDVVRLHRQVFWVLYNSKIALVHLL